MSERLTHITLVEKEAHTLLPGEATYSELHHAWLLGCPSGNECIGNLAGHKVAYDRYEETLSASPSVLCGCGAHYFIEHNQIRWV